jgi:hypothetical protein
MINQFRRWFGGRQDDGDKDGPAVLRALADVVARDDEEAFVLACQEHGQTILKHFASWRVIPEPIRDDPEQVEGYARTLVQIARLFEHIGHPELMALLVGDERSNPILEWDRALVDLKRQVKVGDPRDGLSAAAALLASLQTSGVSGLGLLSARAQVRGVQADVLVQLGRHEEARAATEQALADCEQAGDVEGVRVYTSNLAWLDSQRPALPDDIDLEIEILEQMRLALRRTDLGRYEASNEVLEALLGRSGAAAPIIERLRPHLMGRIGFNEFKLGHLDAARERVTAARDGCVAARDEEGAEIYGENLGVIGRAGESSDTGGIPG